MDPKRRFWKGLQKMRCGCLIDFLMVRSPNRVLTPAEKGVENTHLIFCNSFQNLRLETIYVPGTRPFTRLDATMLVILVFHAPKRRFWKNEQTLECGFSMDFSMVRSPNRVLTPAEMDIENAHFSVCNSFQNHRLGGMDFDRTTIGITARICTVRRLRT